MQERKTSVNGDIYQLMAGHERGRNTVTENVRKLFQLQSSVFKSLHTVSSITD